jgi:hypothetical protein
MCVSQHCFICRPSDSTVSEDVGIEPRTVATLVLTARRSNHSARSHPLQKEHLALHDIFLHVLFCAIFVFLPNQQRYCQYRYLLVNNFSWRGLMTEFGYIKFLLIVTLILVRTKCTIKYCTYCYLYLSRRLLARV